MNASYLLKTLKNITQKDDLDFEYVKSGFKKLDYTTGGFKKKEITIIGSRPAIGKTSFCLNLCSNILIDSSLSIVFFSLELSSKQLFKQIKCQNNNQGLKKIINSDLYIVETDFLAFDFSKFKQTLKNIKQNKDLDVVIIDYFQLISENEINNSLMIKLKKLAEELNIALVITSQLSRLVEERPDKIPIIEDLNLINGNDECIDNIYFLYQKSIYDHKNKSIIIAKHPKFKVKGKTIPLKYNCYTFRFY